MQSDTISNIAVVELGKPGTKVGLEFVEISLERFGDERLIETSI